MNVPLWVAVPVILLATIAARADVRTRKIPNRLTFPAILLALVAHAALGGPAGLMSSLAGLAVALVLVPGWLMRWMGAGDVKLMAAAGAWLAWPQAGIALLASLAAGGAIAVFVAARRGVLWTALRGAALMGASGLAGTASAGPPPVSTGIRFPFALAVLAGCTLALWVRG
jgi:prepilin peptidase CpaA